MFWREGMTTRFVDMYAIRNQSAVASGPPADVARTDAGRATTYWKQRLATEAEATRETYRTPRFSFRKSISARNLNGICARLVVYR